jgi:hypothetical protein
MSGVAMKRTTVGFSEPFYLRLQEVAAEHGISVSQLIREGVLFYLAYEQGLADRKPLPRRPSESALRDDLDTPS